MGWGSRTGVNYGTVIKEGSDFPAGGGMSKAVWHTVPELSRLTFGQGINLLGNWSTALVEVGR